MTKLPGPGIEDQSLYAVILAGGSGTRFWPKSRLKRPKQLCRIVDHELTMIEQTLNRLDGFIPPERRIIVTHKDQLSETKRIVANKCAHFIAEPEARNTAAALALAAIAIRDLHGNSDAVMISLHADHVIERTDEFVRSLSRSAAVAKSGYLTLIGIQPTEPSTGFGYIECGSALKGNGLDQYGANQVSAFREKPDLETAQSYLKRGNFLWNSGYFIWRVDVIIEQLVKFLPETINALEQFHRSSSLTFFEVSAEQIAEVYRKLPKIAIDNAVLEKSDSVVVVPGNFGWQDVGSWDALDKCIEPDDHKNLMIGDALQIDCRNTTIDAESMFVACIGLEDFVVVQSGNAILVCPKNRAQDVKKIVETLQASGRTDLI